MALWLFPLLAVFISLFFALDVFRAWQKRRRPSDGLFALSLFLFAAAAFGEFYGSAFGWNPVMYKIYYFPAIALVAFMAAGTLYARGSNWLSRGYLIAAVLLSAAFLVALIAAPVDPAIWTMKGPVGGEFMPGSVRIFSPLLSAVGGLILLGSAAYSWWQTRRDGFLIIFAAALVLSSGGVLAKYVALPEVLPLTELIGIALYYAGILRLGAAARRATEGGEKAAGSRS
ncbi:hypothetical protein AB1399_02495 [Hydrogenibacillus schlegelii]|uniref:Uncharacterized protein n=1 Tax=Hydrogenibacillus schlegelii TaxID=1484 RepID=A0A132N9H4_HYDSH|nr:MULTISPECIES: hypothetical protein [Hydrogenibacillus]KWX06617.1 hypothetical protein TR75_05310 [Hydrogenibacillus schlegelii]MBT9282161.1 hypothetical protein [Hydrogenibacillus schlegelii]OAR04192.1 hypothetical protein SA87_06985 [Hydrogenibacillus schlegelii]PTQ54541.1 MAG: hypothetical protein HSCHL_0120 [Hydrogenibacillus schlegelii]QZA32973.1 hypothetical protein K2M58_12170 [Hydrogenibacillus sp. N12]